MAFPWLEGDSVGEKEALHWHVHVSLPVASIEAVDEMALEVFDVMCLVSFSFIRVTHFVFPYTQMLNTGTQVYWHLLLD